MSATNPKSTLSRYRGSYIVTKGTNITERLTTWGEQNMLKTHQLYLINDRDIELAVAILQ